MIWTGSNHASPIALDAGCVATRALQLQREAGGWSVRRWARWPVGSATAGPEAPDARPGGRDPIDLRRQGFLGREAVLCLNPPDVEFCPLRVPEALLALEHERMLAAVRHEVARHARTPVQEAQLDAWPLPAGQGDCPNLMVAVAPAATVQGLIGWVEACGCACTRIDAAPAVVLRARRRLLGGAVDDCIWGVLDVGWQYSRLYIGLGEVPVYVRCIQRGGEHFTRRIASELGVEPQIAERYKRRYGIAASEAGYRPVLSPDALLDERRLAAILLGALRPAVRGISEEIKRSFDYAMELYPDKQVTRVEVCGGGAVMPGFCAQLAAMLGIEVVGADAWTAPDVPRRPADLSADGVIELTTALGLALGEVMP